MLRRHDNTRGRGGFLGWIGLKRTFVVTSALALIVAWGLAGEWLHNREMQREIDRLQSRAEEMEDKNRHLAETSRTVSSAAMLEREARTKMNLQKPGEQVVVVNGSGSGVQAVEVAVTDDTGPPSNAGKWWHYFFR